MGGWSEFDGKNWVHHLKIKELQGYPITALLPDGDKMWVGTQGRGLCEVDSASEKTKWHDERNGLPDDWVKRIVKCSDSLFAGTFVSGLARMEASGWTSVQELGKGEITDLVAEADGSLLAATRTGLWRISSNGKAEKIEFNIPSSMDAQAICSDSNGIWIGTRTGIWCLQRN